MTAPLLVMLLHLLTGCTYTVSTPDSNPASHYPLLPSGCKLSNGIGVVVLLMFVLVAFGMANFKLVGSMSEESRAEQQVELMRSNYTRLDQRVKQDDDEY